MSNPHKIAQSVARVIDSDPVMARLIKENLSEERLLDLLEIRVPEPEPPEDPDPVETIRELGIFAVLRAYTVTQILEADACINSR